MISGSGKRMKLMMHMNCIDYNSYDNYQSNCRTCGCTSEVKMFRTGDTRGYIQYFLI